MTSRLPATVASAVGGRGTISIRRALPAEGRAIARHEALADRRIQAGPILLAALDRELVATKLEKEVAPKAMAMRAAHAK